jgi:hypothetical protein
LQRGDTGLFWIDYSNLPSTEWASHLSQASKSSTGRADLPLYWGAHETIQGVLDFTQNSRLRLEKILTLAHSQKVSVRVHLGFNSDERSFPAWTKTLAPTAVIPVANGKDLFGEIETKISPSLLNEEVKKGFFLFLEEVFNILNLYAQPQGPIEAIYFNWGPLQQDSNLIDSKSLSRYLESRYESVSQLNALYQTCFRDFDSASSRMGIRTLFDKRPWIAAWDFKNGRSHFLCQIESEINKNLEARALASLTRFSGEGPLEETTVKAPIFIEDTLIETLGEERSPFPLMVLGQLTPAAISAFRLAEMVRLGAARNGTKVDVLSRWEPSSGVGVATILASKFVSGKKADLLLDWVSKGGKLFFPFGLPQWDEKLNVVKWGESTEREKKRVEQEELLCMKWMKGQVWVPVKEWEKSPQLHSRVAKVVDSFE